MDINILAPFVERLGPMAAIFAASFLQSITGFGLMITASPLMMIFYDAKFTVRILIFLGLCANSMQASFLWRNAKFKLIGCLLLGAVCGQLIGYKLYNFATPDTLKIIISIILLCFLTVNQFTHFNFQQNTRNSLIAGLFSGVMATSVSLAGPALILYFANTEMDRLELRSTTVVYFMLMNLSSLSIFLLGGYDMAEAGKEFFYMLPGLFVGLAAGQYAYRHTSPQLFRRLLFAMLYYICGQSLFTALFK